MKKARPDLPFSVTVKSVAVGLMFPTMPVGVPGVLGELLADAGIVTNRGICTPAPVYSVENPEPLSLSQNGLASSAVRWRTHHLYEAKNRVDQRSGEF